MPGKVQYLCRKRKVKYNCTLVRLLFYTLTLHRKWRSKFGSIECPLSEWNLCQCKVVICLFMNHSIRSHGEVEAQFHLFLTSSLEEAGWSVLWLLLYPWEESSTTSCTECWIGLTVGQYIFKHRTSVTPNVKSPCQVITVTEIPRLL
jgi:hypothetical protein